MPFRLPRRSFYGGRIIDAYSHDSSPNLGNPSRDPATGRFRAIAEILLRGIRRCVTADHELNNNSEQFSNAEKPVLDNLANSLPEPLDLVSDKALSVSYVSKTLGFGDAQDIQNGGDS